METRSFHGDPALITVGGLGTRLRPTVGDTPDPIADVGRGHGADAVERYFGTGAGRDLSIAYSRDPEPLGAGGALRFARPSLDGEPLLVMNGDSYFEIPTASLVAQHVRARVEVG